LHVAAAGQAGQVRGHPALGQADLPHALGHRVLGDEQELQQPQPILGDNATIIRKGCSSLE
jgi:hypothetical protein